MGRVGAGPTVACVEARGLGRGVVYTAPIQCAEPDAAYLREEEV